MCRIGLIVEYSRMQVPSLSRGCEIAQFFVRYMVARCDFTKGALRQLYPSQTKILEGWTTDENADFRSTFQGNEYSILATNR
jgi:hypothetical protein